MRLPTIRACAGVALLVSAPLLAQAPAPVAPAPNIVPDCKAQTAQDIVVCGRRGERSPFRLPPQPEGFDPDGPLPSVSRERHRLYEVGDTGIGSCSNVGPGGWTGCDFLRWKDEHHQDPARVHVLSGFDRADLVVSVGYDLVEYAPARWNPDGRKRIIHIDTQPAEVDAFYQPEVELVGDIDGTLRRLLAAVLPHGIGGRDVDDAATSRRDFGFEVARYRLAGRRREGERLVFEIEATDPRSHAIRRGGQQGQRQDRSATSQNRRRDGGRAQYRCRPQRQRHPHHVVQRQLAGRITARSRRRPEER